MTPGKSSAASRGIALITGLVLLVILTIVALSTMRTTSLEYRMSSNTAYSSQTRQVSESGRLAVSSVLHEHVFERSWSGVSIPSGCAILDKDSDGMADSLIANSSGETFDAADLLGSLTDDAQYTDSVSGLTSTISVYHAATKLSAGSGAAMSAGYMGLGKGAGGGGAAMYYYLISESTGHASARSVTSADLLEPIGH
jgi:Tfp pilus assembly protein PilX